MRHWLSSVTSSHWYKGRGIPSVGIPWEVWDGIPRLEFLGGCGIPRLGSLEIWDPSCDPLEGVGSLNWDLGSIEKCGIPFGRCGIPRVGSLGRCGIPQLGLRIHWEVWIPFGRCGIPWVGLRGRWGIPWVGSLWKWGIPGIPWRCGIPCYKNLLTDSLVSQNHGMITIKTNPS